MGMCIDVVILLTTKGRARTCLSTARNSSSYTSCPPSSCTGFQVKKKQFFRNFMTIILFGDVGTMISRYLLIRWSYMDKPGGVPVRSNVLERKV
nr:sodium/hydrogen exchanger 1-like [Lolium perenne]